MDYVGLYKEAAVSEMQRTGIPASIKLAQGIIESASGRSELALTANNHFGIKCGNNWTGKVHNKKDDDRDPGGNLVESCFRKYNTPQESFFDHSEFLRDPRKSNRYGFLFNLDRRDYKSWARGLQSSGYATSPLYADQLIDLIERLRLYEHDQPGGTHIAPGSVIPAAIPPQERITRVNNVKAVNSREGETLADIANLYRLRPDKVADFNDRAYPPGQYILPGTRIFIEKKRNQWSGQTTHHFVREGQTMLDISQQYGAKLECLYTMNGMQFGAEPAPNEKIRIRGKREKNETVRLRDDLHNDPSPATTATGPTTMKPDDEALIDMTPATGNTPAKPNTPPVIMPDKPATTGVPYPTDPVPSTTTTPPPSGTGWTTGTVPPTSNPAATIPAGYHQVVKGDTLFSLARKYSITVARIKELNNLPSDNIQLGQVLRVR
ncbi:MAG: glucosaminidase domain-containing protein [Saprospiraceae bacterium]